MNDADSTLTVERLRVLLNYDPLTGIFHWRKSRSGVQIHRPAGSTNKVHGYVVLGIDKQNFYAHRLAWFYVTSNLPTEIDHIDNVRTNNKFANLRDVPHLWNTQNRLNPTKQNTSGYPGVSRVAKGFRARLSSNRKEVSLGVFPTAEEAYSAYVAKKREMHVGYTG